MKKILAMAMVVAGMVAQGAMNVVTNQLGEIGNDEYVVTSITGAAIETNEVNALILAYDMTNLTVRFNGKLDLPPMLAPTNWIPVSIGNGRAEWMPNIGGGGGSLGSVNYITDADGKCYPVYATTNSEGKVIQVVGQIPIAPMKKTVEQEEFRAVTAETLLYTNALAETAQRIATDNMLLDKINAISALGRLISTWDCEAGRPTTEPLTEEITYKSGDYYLVGKVATNATNFIPNGTVYHRGQQSTTPALDDVYVNDVYRHTEDGSWVHTVMAGVMVRWEQIDGNPTNNHHFVESVNDLSFVVVTQTVDKAYVESLGIDVGISTAAVERIVVQYDATNLSSRIDARVEKPDETIPAGYSLVRGVTNLTEWVMLPGTNIVGYLCYIRDAESNAYRVVAMKNPNNEIVAAIEQTPTPMEIITIEEERLARIAGDLAGTNYTDSATNALSLALVPRIVEAAEKGTNYTDSATNAVTSWVRGTFLPLAGGTMAGDINMDSNGINITDNAKITFDNAGESLMFKSLCWHTFSNIDTTKVSTLLPDGTDVLTAKKAETDYPAITNAYAYTDAATNRVAGMIADEAALRASGDTALATSIASEASAREAGDSDLDTKIAVEKERAETKEELLNVAITNEAAVRASGDAVLQTNIGIETTRATVNEAALGRRIDALVDGTNTVAEMVRTEKTRAETAEAGLIPKSEKGLANGVATLDGTGKVPVAQIPTIAVEWGNIGGTLDNQTDLTNRFATKQDKLPEVVKDYYLHANFIDGHLEWKGIEGGDISNYNALAQKPIINGNVLTGGVNLASADLGLMSNLVFTAAENGKVLGVVNTNLAWVTGGGGGGTNENCREKSDYAYYAEDYYDLEPLKEALGIDYAYLVLADEKFRKQSTSTHWRWYMYNADFEMIGRSQEYSSPENAHASIINIECALGWAFVYKKATPGPGIKTNRRIITEYEAGIEGGYQTNLNVAVADEGKVLGIKNYKLSWVEGGGGSDDCIPIVKTVANATSLQDLFEKAFGKEWNSIPQNSSMFVYATGLTLGTFPATEGYCILRFRTFRYAYIEFILSTGTDSTQFNKYVYPDWSGWKVSPLPVYKIENPTSYMDIFNRMGYGYNKDGFTASGIATGLNCDPAKGDYFPHPNMYITVSTLNSANFLIHATGFNQTGILWERRQEYGTWRPWTRIDGNVSQMGIYGGYNNDCDGIFAEAFHATNSAPDKATMSGYGYNLYTTYFPETEGFLTLRQIDSNNRQIEFRSLKPDVYAKYNTKTNGVWTGWKNMSGSTPTDTLILNGDEDIITGPYVIPHGYGEEGQMLVSKGTNAPPEWSDQPIMVLNGTITNAIGPVVIPGGYGQKGNLLVGNGDSSPTWLANGTAGNILVSGGANADPLWKGLETASITRESTSSGSLIVRKIGRFCSISVNQLASTSGGSGTAALVGTISGTNYLPVDDYFGVSITPINGGSSAYLLIRNESSTMKVYIKGHTSGTKYYGSGFYITK